MIPFPQAIYSVIQSANQLDLPTQRTDLTALSGRICAERITAPRPLQPFTNSAMDGFAFRHQDHCSSHEHQPYLRVRSTIAAGETPPAQPLPAGECDRILTGAVLPNGADSVIPLEQTETSADGYVSFHHMPKLGANVRKAGEDIAAEQLIIEPGTLLDPGHIMPLAALGIENLAVYRKPRVATITTGNEVTQDLGTQLKQGQIFDSNHFYTQALLRHLSCDLVDNRHLQDDKKLFVNHLHYLLSLDLDMVISSGAVSAGAEYDFVREGLQAIGAEIIFHKVAIRPGKPNLFARLPNGALYFGLPGNPLATAAGLRFLVAAALRAMTNQPVEQPLIGQCTTTHSKKSGISRALLCTCVGGQDQRLLVNIPDSQSSFMTNPLLTANSWVLLNEDKDDYKPGDKVDTYPLLPGQRSWPKPAAPKQKKDKGG
ncbi:molybdopterin molybdotransferase MoeA [Halorhodospira halochloris]|uniref:molybdopterin molybdotransferase MoeA n=1 Tax=Halorhodospira halochloris TaxID=1052 RepID=UPI001EE90E48|nr:molybdopterin molybdotransferase MoeA [Halorhodospira halochloris]MCG5547471.1 molybdopterin molybdotransferase MoeA [Halorhodospira halochloris]